MSGANKRRKAPPLAKQCRTRLTQTQLWQTLADAGRIAMQRCTREHAFQTAACTIHLSHSDAAPSRARQPGRAALHLAETTFQWSMAVQLGGNAQRCKASCFSLV